MLHDVRHALRLLGRAPAYAIAAIATLALGVGANAALFSIARAVLFAPLPFREPSRLVAIWHTYGSALPRAAVSPPSYLDLRAARGVFADACAYTLDDMNLTGGGEPERVAVARATATFQSVLGLRLARGRWFSEDEDAPNHGSVVVLSDGVWRRRFGADAAIIGHSISLNDRPYVVVGVLAEGAAFPRRADAWVPVAFTAAERGPEGRGSEFLEVAARLGPGVSVAQARERVRALADEMRHIHHANVPAWTIDLRPLPDDLVGDAAPIVAAMACAVLFVLLVACVNLASLTLARGAERTQEFAVRAALGAEPSRLRRQLLTETATIGALGGFAGVALASLALPVVARGAAAAFALDTVPRIDPAAFLFALTIALACSVAFGVGPAWRASRTDLRRAVDAGGRGTIGSAVRTLLVASEVALAFVVLVGAGLLVRSFDRILAVDPGFQPAHRLTARVSLPTRRYPPASAVRAGFYARLFERLGTLPGVRAAGGVSELPLGELKNMGSFDIRERTTPVGQPEPHGDWRSASPGYFRAMGIELVRGRLFSDVDGLDAPPVAIVDEEAARRLWPNEDPIGSHVSIDNPDVWREVVGVVRSVRHDALDAPSRSTVYFPLAQRPTATVFAVVDAGRGRADALAAALRAGVQSIDPELPVYDVQTLEGRLDDSLGRRRLAMWLVVAFALVATALSIVGLYGVTAYDVGQRTREIAVRMALGADRGRVLAWVLWRSARPTMAGLLAGIAAALALTRLGAGLLYSVAADDPITYVVTTVLVVVTAAAAGYLPARRATRVDPIVELR